MAPGRRPESAPAAGLKERISSPLEAGPSVLDARRLPPLLVRALEYASRRLASRSLHLTLVVVRRDYQLPSVVPPGLSAPVTPPATPPASAPSRLALGPVTALKQLVRTASRRPRRRASSQGSPAASDAAVASPPGLRLPCSPSPSSPPPLTPSTASSHSPMTTTMQGTLGLRLVHAPHLSSRARKMLASTLARAEQKFGNGEPWLSPAMSPAACGLPDHLFNSSMAQNEVLFSSEALSLVSLERLYSLKSALSSYTRTLSPMRLEDAVDELRRFVLAGNGAKATRADLLRSFDWLSVTSAAIADLDHMYRRAYGGPEQVGAISGMPSPAPAMTATPGPVVCSSGYHGASTDAGSPGPHPHRIGIAVTTGKAPSPRGPILKLRTDFDPRSPVPKEQTEGDGEDDGDLTARPQDIFIIGFNPIDRLLSAGVSSPVFSTGPCSRGPGPLTPNGYDDLSPVTRDEWGLLMVDNALQGGRSVAVETC